MTNYNDAEHLPIPFKHLGPQELLSLEHQDNLSHKAKRLYGYIANSLLFWGVTRRNSPDSKLMAKGYMTAAEFVAARQELADAELIEFNEIPGRSTGTLAGRYQILHTPRTRRLWIDFWDQA